MLADRGLETKPEVVGGQAYFVANDEQQTETLDELNSMIISTLKLKMIMTSNWIFKTMVPITPLVDRLLCGRVELAFFSITRGGALYLTNDARFDITKGVNDLGYTTRFDREAIKESLRKFYNIV